MNLGEGNGVTTCRSSGTALVKVLDLGLQPLGNGFRQPDDESPEPFFHLECGFAEKSCLFQLIQQPAPEAMFHDDYAFQTGSSLFMVSHFTDIARHLRRRYLLTTRDPFVVEIGCNDGTFLKSFAADGIRHLGVEPSANVAGMAASAGINVTPTFFSKESAFGIEERYGKADLIFAANVMCHIGQIQDVAEGISSLLGPTGVFVFEDPYLGSVVERNSYDQIYDEHVFLFSALSVGEIFAPHGLQLIDVEWLPVHGGSMRYTLAKSRSRSPGATVMERLAWERHLGLDRTETYLRFAERVAQSGQRLRDFLASLVAEGLDVVAYGATSKSTTVYNYSRIDTDLIRCIYDNTPSKQGRVSPGVHIPVYAEEGFADSGADVAYLGAWNHANEITTRNSFFTERGGRWLTHVPEVSLIET